MAYTKTSLVIIFVLTLFKLFIGRMIEWETMKDGSLFAQVHDSA